VFLSVQSCKDKKTSNSRRHSVDQKVDSLKYAEGFSITEEDGYKLVTIRNPWQGADNVEYKYAVTEPGSSDPTVDNKTVVIKTPIKKVVCLSTTHIAFLDVLNETKSVVAVSGTKYVNNEELRKKINRKEVYDVGYDSNLNYEIIASLNPDLVITYGVGGQVAGYNQKLNDLGIQTIIIAEYLENHPLGKLEWIKLLGEFYGKRKQADVYFETIEKEYHSLIQLTDSTKNKPKVLFGLPWKDVWHVPGGESYLARMVKDAGGNYIWSNNDSHESLPFGAEAIFAQASDAEVWLNTGSVNSKEDILKIDERLINFKPFHESKIYNNNLRVNGYGGHDYWEKGLVQPHIILKDMIHIIHPEILPEHELEYYKKIQ